MPEDMAIRGITLPLANKLCKFKAVKAVSYQSNLPNSTAVTAEEPEIQLLLVHIKAIKAQAVSICCYGSRCSSIYLFKIFVKLLLIYGPPSTTICTLLCYSLQITRTYRVVGKCLEIP